jgi:hypothetical protein
MQKKSSKATAYHLITTIFFVKTGSLEVNFTFFQKTIRKIFFTFIFLQKPAAKEQSTIPFLLGIPFV